MDETGPFWGRALHHQHFSSLIYPLDSLSLHVTLGWELLLGDSEATGECGGEVEDGWIWKGEGWGLKDESLLSYLEYETKGM